MGVIEAGRSHRVKGKVRVSGGTAWDFFFLSLYSALSHGLKGWLREIFFAVRSCSLDLYTYSFSLFLRHARCGGRREFWFLLRRVRVGEC